MPVSAKKVPRGLSGSCGEIRLIHMERRLILASTARRRYPRERAMLSFRLVSQKSSHIGSRHDG
jgi:hypothetical protein